MLHHLLRTIGWQFEMTRSGLAMRISNALSLLLVAAISGMAIGYSLTGRRRQPPDEDDEATSAPTR